MAEETEAPKPKARKRGERLSLHPLTLTEAVRGLLGVPPSGGQKGGDDEAGEDHQDGEDSEEAST